MTWTRTISGKYIDLLEPTPEMIDFADIASALARLCRFNGHIPKFYSVLQHSLEVASVFSPDDPEYKYALLHDAHEAFTGDIVTPVKVILGQPLQELQDRLDRAIFEAAGLVYPMPEKVATRVYMADQFTLRCELWDIFGIEPEIYEIPHVSEFARDTPITPTLDTGKLTVDWLKALGF